MQEHLGLTVVENLGQGDCMFHALAQALRAKRLAHNNTPKDVQARLTTRLRVDGGP